MDIHCVWIKGRNTVVVWRGEEGGIKHEEKERSDRGSVYVARQGREEMKRESAVCVTREGKRRKCVV